ncbi:hypothetical protein D9M71_493210 [compost metagenome]
MQHPAHQPVDLTRVGHARGIGQGDALDAEFLIGVDDLQYPVLIDLAFKRAAEGGGDAGVESHRAVADELHNLAERRQ